MNCNIKSKDLNSVKTVTADTNSNYTFLRCVLNALVAINFMGTGICSYVIGPTLVHLTYLYDTDISSMSVVFTFQLFGMLFGSLLCGLIFDRLNRELQLALCSLIFGLTTIVAPWIPNLYGFCTAYFLANIARGYQNASLQSYMIGIWAGHRLQQPCVQVTYASNSLGAFLSPFLVSPFLDELPDDSTSKAVSASEVKSLAKSNSSSLLAATSSQLSNATVISSFDQYKVRYAYLLVGCTVCLTAVALFIAYFLVKSEAFNKAASHTVHHDRQSAKEKTASKKFNKLSTKIPLIIMLFLFYHIYSWYELVIVGFTSTLVIKGLGWQVVYGSAMTSVYHLSVTLGRLFAVPLSTCFSPAAMMFYSVSFTIMGLILMLFAPIGQHYTMWLAMFLSGFAVASTFGGGAVWLSSHIPVTGRIASVFYIGYGIGGMCSGLVAGYMFEYYHYMWVVYIPLMATVAQLVLVFIIYFFIKYNIKRQGFVVDSEMKSRDICRSNLSLTL